MVIEIPCTCGHLLSSKELNKLSKKELAKILFEQPIEMVCKKCGEVFQVFDKTRFLTADKDDTWKSYA
ncbi:MAG: hypothetical protein WC788_06990 [Candidatus Paceibacterota bacterium]|jgi:redox-regulated HSP33 family molecular chaperone